jgi:chromosome segregation ATPase
MLQEVTVTGAH